MPKTTLTSYTATSPMLRHPMSRRVYVDAIITYCAGPAEFPHRGLARDDIRPGLRTTSYRKRTVVAFAVLDDVVAIIGIFHGGRDYEALLRDADT